MNASRFAIAVLAIAAPVAPASADSSPTRAVETSAASRTLDDTVIEGDIAVPGVLFINARDQCRFLDFLSDHYLKSSLVLAQETALPARFAVSVPGERRVP
jgi:hypothetical protein